MWGAGCAGGGAAPLLCCLLLRFMTPAFGSHLLIKNMTQDYEVNEWPTMETGGPTVVTVQMYFNTFGSLDARHMDFKIDMFLLQRWNDPRLEHSKIVEYFTITDSALHDKIWKPDTYFENVKEAHIHQVTVPNKLMRVYTSGDILYNVRVTLRLACHLQLQLFPFDAQKCYVHLSSYANTDDVIRYQWVTDNPVIMSDGIEIAQFDMMATSTYSRTQVFNRGLHHGNYSSLSASFTLHRQNGYHLLQTYIPTIMIVSISWVSFWLDPNAVPGRVTLGVTTLLTLTTLASGMRQSLPPVSYVKAIDVWVGMCMVMVFGALLEFTLVNYLANKKMINSRLPDLFTVPVFLAGKQDPSEEDTSGTKKEELAAIELIHVHRLDGDTDGVAVGGDPTVGRLPQKLPDGAAPKRQGEGPTYMFYALVLDRICRVFFPTIFLLFNIFYWPYYVYMQRTSTQSLLENI